MALALERVLTSPKAFGLTEATPMQRAVCRIFDGLRFEDLLAEHPELAGHLDRTCGPGGLERLPTELPREVYLLSGIRTAKSLIAAAVAFRAAMTVDLSMLRPWEKAVVSVLSLTREKALVVLGHLLGPLLAHPQLRALMPRPPTGARVWLRRPHDGRVVLIRIAAGARAGGSLVGDWSAGAIFDEFTRMTGEEEGSVINFDDSRKAVIGRLLPGAQLVGVGSPWAPHGAAFEIVKKHWGNPSPRIVVLRPPSRAMNPRYWTDETIEALRKSPKGEHVYKTDYLGEFADPESAFFTSYEIEACVRKDGPLVLPPQKGVQYFAAMDPAMRRNAWTLIIAGRYRRPDGTTWVRVALARQWIPTREEPLLPEAILTEIRDDCARYGVREVMTDGWRSAELESIGRRVGLAVTDVQMTATDMVRLCDSLRLRALSGGLELPDDPYVKGDLLAMRKIVRNRSIGMDWPVTQDGRHCDYDPPMAIVNDLAGTSTSWVDAMRRLKERGGTVF